MIHLIHALAVMLACSQGAEQPQPYRPPLSSEGEVNPEHIREVKSSRDMQLAVRYPATLQLRIVDDVDGLPIEGVPIGGFADVTDKDGRFTQRLEQESGVVLGRVAELPLFFPGRDFTLKKHGQPLDSTGFMKPRSVYFPVGDTPPTAALAMEVRLARGSRTMDGVVVVVDDRVLPQGVVKNHQTKMIVDSDYVGGDVLVRKDGTVTIGPLPALPQRAFVQVYSQIRSFHLEPNFRTRVEVVDDSGCGLQVNLIENSLLRLGEGRVETSGFTFVRVNDQVAYTSVAYATLTIFLPAGRYIVLPGLFEGRKLHTLVFDGLAQGLDLTPFGFTFVDLAEGEAEKVVKLSARSSLDAIARLEQELAKRKAANEPLVAPAGDGAIPAPSPR